MAIGVSLPCRSLRNFVRDFRARRAPLQLEKGVHPVGYREARRIRLVFSSSRPLPPSGSVSVLSNDKGPALFLNHPHLRASNGSRKRLRKARGVRGVRGFRDRTRYALRLQGRRAADGVPLKVFSAEPEAEKMRTIARLANPKISCVLRCGAGSMGCEGLLAPSSASSPLAIIRAPPVLGEIQRALGLTAMMPQGAENRAGRGLRCRIACAHSLFSLCHGLD